MWSSLFLSGSSRTDDGCKNWCRDSGETGELCELLSPAGFDESALTSDLWSGVTGGGRMKVDRSVQLLSDLLLSPVEGADWELFHGDG